MTAKELFDAGKLTAAIDQLNQDVKSHPADSHSRTFLFELLCLSGDYDRAERQLDAIVKLGGDVSVEVGAQVYRNTLEAERARHKLFSEGGRPGFLTDQPQYVSLHLDAMKMLVENRPAEAKALLEESDSSRSPVKGRAEGKDFQSFRDSDDLIGPFLEAIVQKEYVWLPFEQIKRIEITPPKRLRDLLWIPAKVELHKLSLGEVFLPALYAGSSEHPDDLVKLGRMTDWKPVEEGLTLGTGQRMFLIDDEDRAILELREVQFEANS